jgi:hypothetical protein
VATGSASPGTINQYAPLFRDWEDYARSNGATPEEILPASITLLAQYLVSRALRDESRGNGASNTKARMSAINFFHRLRNYQTPEEAHPVLQQIRKSAIRLLGIRAMPRMALHQHHIFFFERHYATLKPGLYGPPEQVQSFILTFLYSLMYEGSLRWDDVISPVITDCVWGSQDFRLFLTDTKTDYKRSGMWAYFIADHSLSVAYRLFLRYFRLLIGTWLASPVSFKQQYLKDQGLPLEPLDLPFSSIHFAANWKLYRSSCHLTPFEAWMPVTNSTISYDIALTDIKTRAATFGFSKTDIGLHSLRRGAASDDARFGLPDTLSLIKGRWRSATSNAVYIEGTSYVEARLRAIRAHLPFDFS